MPALKSILCINFVFWTLSSFGQDNFWNEKGLIVSTYSLMQANDSTFQIKTVAKEPDTFKVQVSGTDSLSITHFFQTYTDGSVDDESLCDSLIIELHCGACTEEHLNKLFRSKERKWLKISDSAYVSQKAVSKFWLADKSASKYRVPIMEIHSRNYSAIIIIYSKVLTKEEWKVLKRKID